jgi:hypothetical protein
VWESGEHAPFCVYAAEWTITLFAAAQFDALAKRENLNDAHVGMLGGFVNLFGSVTVARRPQEKSSEVYYSISVGNWSVVTRGGGAAFNPGSVSESLAGAIEQLARWIQNEIGRPVIRPREGEGRILGPMDTDLWNQAEIAGTIPPDWMLRGLDPYIPNTLEVAD